MFALIKEAAQSRDTIKAFCAARDLNVKTFFYWRRKFLAAKPSSKGFLPLNLQPAVSQTAVRLTYPNGVDLHLPSADLTLIAQLIRLA